ncbi:hypothetical protein IV203_000492 [Nitzschia inconspicua]|uniref:Uncharacterized protein n=1 Tax=Nitzschia inconspicua TaxID=303405 RepID=A0A9K3L6N0_9STRA|nr:hypothetical protein IV203_000492 [Nitzschia inconspicua]
MILTLQTHQKSSNNVEQIEVVLLGTGTSIPVEKYDKIPTRIVSETSNLLMTSNLNVNGTVKKPAIRHVMSIDAIYDQVEFLEKICSVHFSYIVDAFFNETDRFPIKSRKLMLLDGIHPIDTTRIVSETSNLLMTSNLNVNGTVKKPAIRHVMSIDAIYDQVEFLEKICSEINVVGWHSSSRQVAFVAVFSFLGLEAPQLPALYWCFTAITCFVNVECAAMSFYKQFLSDNGIVLCALFTTQQQRKNAMCVYG